MTPDSTNWDPYSDHFANNEDAILDWQGDIIEPKYRRKHLLDIPTLSDPTISSLTIPIPSYEEAIDSVMSNAFTACSISSDPFDGGFANVISSFTELGKFGMSVGSLTVSDSGSNEHILDKPIITHIDEADWKELYEVSASAKKPKGVSADFLSKIWNIQHEQAKGVLAQTTQLNRQGADNDLSRRFSTNDRMLRYKRINSMFFTDTFFVTASGKSTRGNTSAQIFVSDKGFVAIYPMKHKSDFPDALHLFCKEVGVPESLIVDPSGEQTSRKVKKFCNQVGTSLRILGESTQWANRAELYVGLFKEAVRKDLRKTNCPLKLWDFCAER